MEIHSGVGVFIIILEIRVESACLAVCSLLNTEWKRIKRSPLRSGKSGRRHCKDNKVV